MIWAVIKLLLFGRGKIVACDGIMKRMSGSRPIANQIVLLSGKGSVCFGDGVVLG
jgi:hypothetical protein